MATRRQLFWKDLGVAILTAPEIYISAAAFAAIYYLNSIAEFAIGVLSNYKQHAQPIIFTIYGTIIATSAFFAKELLLPSKMADTVLLSPAYQMLKTRVFFAIIFIIMCPISGLIGLYFLEQGDQKLATAIPIGHLIGSAFCDLTLAMAWISLGEIVNGRLE